MASCGFAYVMFTRFKRTLTDGQTDTNTGSAYTALAKNGQQLLNTFIRQVGRSTQKINDKQYTKYKKRKEKNNQSLSNLTCSTDTGIMLKNLTLQGANAVSNST